MTIVVMLPTPPSFLPPLLRAQSALALLCLPLAVQAHQREPHAELPWTWDAWVTVPLLLALLGYLAGYLRLRRRSRDGSVLQRRARWFAAGWLVTAGALVSPLHAAGERSFAAHMLEHELLMLVGAPLLVLGRPLGMLLWALPAPLRRLSGSAVRSRAVEVGWRLASGAWSATVLQAVAMWIWHAPALFDRALASDNWHIAQHASFVGTALLFWTAMLDPSRLRRHAARQVACLFLTMLVSGVLGALMALSASPWYAGYAALGMTPFGLTPAEDQQLAGLLMWVPGGLVHLLAALLLLARWLRDASPGELRQDAVERPPLR